jgi:hypothetical protein
MRPTAVPPATGHPASADDNPAGRLLGAWRLVINLRRMEDRGEVVERPDSRGYAVFEPGGRMMVVMATAGRSPPSSDAEVGALFGNMTAYTGRYSVGGTGSRSRWTWRGIPAGRARSRFVSSIWTATS